MLEKPQGKWKCRACGSIWDGSELYDDPMSTAPRWSCGDLTCGATCDPVDRVGKWYADIVSVQDAPGWDASEREMVDYLAQFAEKNK